MWQIQATGSNKLNHTDIQEIEWEVNCKPRNWMFLIYMLLETSVKTFLWKFMKMFVKSGENNVCQCFCLWLF